MIAGALDGQVPPAPPPHSWASRADADVAIWHIRMEPGARWTLPAAAGPDTVRTLYVFEGDELRIDGHEVGGQHRRRCVRADRDVELETHRRRRGAAAAGPPDRRAGRAATARS